MDYTVTVLDTAGIQNYIFGSNELRENIGASELLLRATTLLAFKHLTSCQETHNIINPQVHGWDYRKDGDTPEKELAWPSVTAEVIYAGGGNTVILFSGEDSHDRARKFVYSLSTDLLTTAPGLAIFAAHVPYNPDDRDTSLPQCVKQAIQNLARLKGELPPPSPLLGLSVTAACTSTGLPAIDRHPSEDKVNLASAASREVWAKWRYSGWQPLPERPNGKETPTFAKKRLRDYFDIGQYLWSDDLDLIGRVPGREESFIAVVHADGNGMGRRIMELNNLFDEHYPGQPRAYITAMRALSQALQKTAKTALEKTAAALQKTLDNAPVDEPLHPTRDNKPYFPFRPIVFGGDDVTWVCAGIWGISLARRYLQELEELKLPDFVTLLTTRTGIARDEAERLVRAKQRDGSLPLSNVPYACAGVCIVKTHYPFSQAYAIAESLAMSAKKRVRDLKPDKAASAIDWHFTTTGLTGSLDDIRRREYWSGDHNLVSRPLVLDDERQLTTWRNWKNFHNVWRQFELGWFGGRNKMAALNEALRAGPDAVRQFAEAERRGSRLPMLDLGNSGFLLEDGWVKPDKSLSERIKVEEETRSAYFDAIEVFDMYVSLTDDGEGQ